MRECVCLCVSECVSARVCACMGACACACVGVCVPVLSPLRYLYKRECDKTGTLSFPLPLSAL